MRPSEPCGAIWASCDSFSYVFSPNVSDLVFKELLEKVQIGKWSVRKGKSVSKCFKQIYRINHKLIPPNKSTFGSIGEP